MTFLYIIVWIIFGCYLLYRFSFFKIEGVHRITPVALFVIKVVAFSAFYYIYTFYYTDRQYSDMYKYFDDACYLYECLIKSPSAFIEVLTRNLHSDIAMYYDSKINHWFTNHQHITDNSHRSIILFNFICRFISGGSIFVHGILINLLATIGIWTLFKSMKQLQLQFHTYAIYAIAICPSIVFWGSGLLKEPLYIFFLGITFWFYVNMIQQFSIKWILLVVLSLFFLFIIKSYVFLALCIFILLYTLSNISKHKYSIHIMLSSIFSIMLYALGSYYLPDSISLYKIVQYKMQAMQHLQDSVGAGSGYTIQKGNGVFTIIQYLILAFSRPFIWEVNQPLLMLSAIETSFVAIISIIYVIQFSKQYAFMNVQKRILIIALCCAAIVPLVLSAFVSFNFGTLMRYRMPAWIFLFCAFGFITPSFYKKSK